MIRTNIITCALLMVSCSGSAPKTAAKTQPDAGQALPRGGTESPCRAVSDQAVGWDMATEVGVSAAEAFSPIAGTCQASLHWDASGWGSAQRSETQISISLRVDESSARLERPKNASFPLCHSALLVDAHVELSTADGTFADAADVTLRYLQDTGVAPLGFVSKLEDADGTFSVPLESNQSATLSYQLDGAGASCAGTISLSIETISGGFGMGTTGPLASWSDSGCPVGQAPVDLGQAPTSGGPSVLDAITGIWGKASYPGVWDDGLATSLHLAVEVPVKSACQDTSGPAAMISVPVLLTYGTEDGRLANHAAPAEARATPRTSGTIPTFGLWLSERIECADSTDALPYTRGDCVTLQAIEIQLGVTARPTLSFSDSGLNVYEYDRESSAAPGSADRVRRLTLSP